MFDTIAGIDIGSKGFQSFTIKPQPGGSLISAAAQYHSPYGLIKSRWRKMEKYDEYTLTIPTNTSAEITLPNPSLDDIKVDSLPASEHPNLEINDGNIILHSGTYTLTSIR
jgi:alpha-L-rhamnosidase